MNHAVGGILLAVSVFRESCYRHIVLGNYIQSYSITLVKAIKFIFNLNTNKYIYNNNKNNE